MFIWNWLKWLCCSDIEKAYYLHRLDWAIQFLSWGIFIKTKSFHAKVFSKFFGTYSVKEIIIKTAWVGVMFVLLAEIMLTLKIWIWCLCNCILKKTILSHLISNQYKIPLTVISITSVLWILNLMTTMESLIFQKKKINRIFWSFQQICAAVQKKNLLEMRIL